MKCNLKTPQKMDYLWKKGLCYIGGYGIIGMLILILANLSSCQSSKTMADEVTANKIYLENVDWSIADQYDWSNYADSTIDLEFYPENIEKVIIIPIHKTVVIRYDITDILDMGVSYMNIYVPKDRAESFLADYLNDNLYWDEEAQYMFRIENNGYITSAKLF